MTTRERAESIFAHNFVQLHRRIDRGFLWLLLAQWVFAILVALVLSPLAWEGRRSAIHLHVQVAVLFGGLLNALPIALIFLRPGWSGTRCAIALVQMLWSALLIHLTGGRIETHFHVFGSLAFLAAYGDLRVLLIATATVTADHFARGLLWPESVYGTTDASWWRFLEHAGWVIFEVGILALSGARAVAMYRELAEREARLESAHADVERIVVERTEELRTATHAAQAASRAKSEFLANMSHEIRTPMNSVLGFTDILLDTPLSDEQRDHVETIHRSGDTLLKIINDILDFSKMEARKLTIERAPFDLRKVALDASELLRPAATQKGLALTLQVAEDVPRDLVGDAGRVRQVLLNLIGNAIKFTAAGHVTVEIEWMRARGASDRDEVRCTVTDTGIGIPPDKYELLFQEFSQADGSTTREFGGTGLGLTISKRLLELMGGCIGFTSQVGQGSCFWFTLPTSIRP